MAKRRKSGAGTGLSPLRIALVALLVVAIAAAWWYLRARPAHEAAMRSGQHAAVDDVAGSVTSGEGRNVHLAGKLEVSGPPRDSQLGVAAPAAVLFRHVEMYQWIEHCEREACRYETGWSATRFDSQHFRTPAGHENPARPFADARFVAGDIKLAGVSVDPGVAIAQLTPVDFPVRTADLPPNLAASFRVHDGVLYAGGDPAHPAVGELRVSYRVIAGDAALNGVQRGTRLTLR